LLTEIVKDLVHEYGKPSAEDPSTSPALTAP
jgi:hypothetical protein